MAQQFNPRYIPTPKALYMNVHSKLLIIAKKVKTACMSIDEQINRTWYIHTMEDFTGDSVVKNLPANAGDMGSTPGSGRSPQRREWQPTPVFLPGESHGRRSLVGSGPWGHKESDMTQWLNNSSHTVEYYSAIKRNGILIHTMIQVNLENFIISERSQSLKTAYCMISFI